MRCIRKAERQQEVIFMNHKQIVRMATLAILTAIVVVLQLLGSSIPIGPVSISLTLIPIVVGAALLGPSAGAFLGLVFGVVVTVACVNGTDVGGNMLLVANPAVTVLLCLGKGAAAGAVAGFIYRALTKVNRWLAVLVSAVAAPITNTGIFCLALYLFYQPTLTAWAGDTNLLVYMFVSLIGINFLMETLVNVVCSPIILRILDAVHIIKQS